MEQYTVVTQVNSREQMEPDTVQFILIYQMSELVQNWTEMRYDNFRLFNRRPPLQIMCLNKSPNFNLHCSDLKFIHIRFEIHI